MLYHLLCVCALGVVVTSQIVDPPETVDELDVGKYLGLWYQVLYTNFYIFLEHEKSTAIKLQYTPIVVTTLNRTMS